jgi:hypothetical protein
MVVLTPFPIAPNQSINNSSAPATPHWCESRDCPRTETSQAVAMCAENAGHNSFNAFSNRSESVDQQFICPLQHPTGAKTGTVPALKQVRLWLCVRKLPVIMF